VRVRSLLFCFYYLIVHTPCARAEEQPERATDAGTDDRGPPPDPRKGERSDARISPPSAAQIFLWPPRVLLMPLRFFWKGFSYPLAGMANSEEKHHVSQRLYLMFTTADGMLGVRPEVEYNLSFTPTVGASFFDHKLFGRDTYFDAVFRGSVSDDIAYTRLRARALPSRWASQLDLMTEFNRRDDQLFAGIGMDQLKPSRYMINSLLLSTLARFTVRPEARFVLGTQWGIRRFANGRSVAGDPPIAEVYCVRNAAGRCAVPLTVNDQQVPGFNEGTQFFRAVGGFVVDTRDSTFKPSSGALLELTVDYSHGLGAGDSSNYLRVWGSAMGVLDLWKRTHVLILRAWGMTVVPFGGAPVPFTELVVLGGPDNLRGVRVNFLRDFSGVLFTAEYRWPIWMWMDASLFTDAGGVFGQGWSGFRVEKLVPDVGMALRVRTMKTFYFQIQSAWSPLDHWQFFVSFSAVP
jgi:hypothetical protein